MAGKAAARLAATLEGDEKTGADIVAKALVAPICQIAANAGVEGAVVLEKVSSAEGSGFGYDAAGEKYGDMIEMGIVDPTKVCRSALENAASVLRHGADHREPRGRHPREGSRRSRRPGHGRHVLKNSLKRPQALQRRKRTGPRTGPFCVVMVRG